jgi:hypothetical protein
MTAEDFRELALSFDGAIESQHMNHPDFRAHGRIFATLGYPDDTRGMVKLALSDQAHFVENYPKAFSPVKGAWGLQGSTSVLLSAAQHDTLAQAMELAWKNSALPPAPTTKKAANPNSKKAVKKSKSSQ